MSSERRFYEQCITVRVITDIPLDASVTVPQLALFMQEGLCAACAVPDAPQTITATDTARKVLAMKQDPGMFGLSDTGEDLDEHGSS